MIDKHREGLKTVAVTAIVPTFDRPEKCIETLNKIYSCIPCPAEVIIHIDGNQRESASTIQSAFPQSKILCSTDQLGPGGSRNKLIDAAAYPLIASFDDDSYPLDSDYFQKVVEVGELVVDAAIISAALYHPGEQIDPPSNEIVEVADFPSGACIYRGVRFKEVGGYLPIAVSYGIEEVDLALRYRARGAAIYRADCLRVFHDNDRSGHADAKITSASIVNAALLIFLRYPLLCWPIGVVQIMNKLVWLFKAGRLAGVAQGLAAIPMELVRNRQNRRAVPTSVIFSYLRLRRSSGLQPRLSHFRF
jgi:GT2 family glycosyltransferase